MNNTLHQLAQRAKFRLRAISENESARPREEACLSAKMQYALIASQKKVEDDPLFNRVKKLLEKDKDIRNPLSQLIEHNIYDGLDEAGKEKYIYKLSKRYVEIRHKILENSNQNDSLI